MKRTRYSEEQIIGILTEHEAGAKCADLCREHGMAEGTFYAWKAKYGGMTVSDAKRLKALEDENARLKKLLAELRSLPRGRQPTVGDEVLGSLRRQLRPNSTKAAFATSKFDRLFRRALLERCRKIVAIRGQPRHSRRVNQGKRIE